MTNTDQSCPPTLPSGLAIRLARSGDADLLPDVERSAGLLFKTIPDLAWIAGDTVQSAEHHREFIAAGTEWVAVDHEDRPVGFLSAGVEGDLLHIWELSVADGFQRRGLGAALVATATAYARARGLTAVTLTTFRNVAWNAPFYARLGFRELHDEEVDERLARIFKVEAFLGIPIERRCAMRLAFADET